MSLMLKRKSIRTFKDTSVTDESIQKLLESAMQAPSARNQQPWEFIVIKNRAIIEQLSNVSGGAKPLKNAPLAILTLMREDVSANHMRPQDMAAATQNILLEATNQDLGAVWIGLYPLEERIKNVESIIDCEGKTPFSLIAIGYPKEEQNPPTLRYDSARIKVVK